MNDLPSKSPHTEFVMYADDICAIVSADTADELYENVQSIINELSQWFIANGMQLNLEKSNLLEFSLRPTSDISPLSGIMVGGVSVPLVDKARFVGFTFDRGLQWKDHIETMCARLSSAYYALSRLSATLAKHNLLKAYYGYFHAHLINGIVLWGQSVDRDRPFILQKKVIRRIAHLPSDEPLKTFFVDLRILTVPCIYILEVAKYVRRNLGEFPKKNWVGNRPCKWRNEPLDTMRYRLLKMNKSLHGMGSRIFNKIPTEIHDCKTEFGFLRKLKVWLTQKAFYSVDEFLNRSSVAKSYIGLCHRQGLPIKNGATEERLTNKCIKSDF
ncbi:hypothetical protein NE865_06131 [Phthorimaea operculella]|nr:hypothetical protein NE865_06131 [Phthorimaea operculella]